MRSNNALIVFSLSAAFSSFMAAGCGNGDDRAPDASTDATANAEGSAAGDAAGSDGSSSGQDATLDGGDAGTDGGRPEGGEGGATAQLKHIFYIMMENHGYAEILGDAGASDAGDGGPAAPYTAGLAGRYGLATNYFGVTHPSLPNYLAAISGDFQGIWDDCAAGPTVTCAPQEFVPNSGDSTAAQPMSSAQQANASVLPHWFPGRNIVDQLEERGLSWVAYMESLPAAGDTSEYWPNDTVDGSVVPRKLYAQKHDPFMYFTDIRTNANRLQKIVPFTQFATDIAGTGVPNFVWISPNQCNDMHGVSPDNAAAVGIPDCAGTDAQIIGLGDAFLMNTVPKIMASPAWNEGSAIVIVWDEDDYAGTSGCCSSPTGADGGVLGGARVPAIVISSKVSSHVTSSAAYNHYSLLATIQQLWGFSCLANTCSMTGSQLMTSLFVP